MFKGKYTKKFRLRRKIAFVLVYTDFSTGLQRGRKKNYEIIVFSVVLDEKAPQALRFSTLFIRLPVYDATSAQNRGACGASWILGSQNHKINPPLRKLPIWGIGGGIF